MTQPNVEQARRAEKWTEDRQLAREVDSARLRELSPELGVVMGLAEPPVLSLLCPRGHFITKVTLWPPTNTTWYIAPLRPTPLFEDSSPTWNGTNRTTDVNEDIPRPTIRCRKSKCTFRASVSQQRLLNHYAAALIIRSGEVRLRS